MAIVDNYTKEELIEKIEQCHSFSEFILSLGYKTSSGNNHITVKKRLEAENIDYSKLQGFRNPIVKRTEENIFIENSTASQHTLRRWYLKGEYSPYKCNICNMEPVWQNKPLTLILDHINGNSRDDRLENLQWVCPNCNQQLETTGYKKMRSPGMQKYFCPDCGKEICYGSKYCAECSFLHRREFQRPSREELKQLIRTTPFTTIAKQFNTTDNNIRKWCIAENLPSKVKDIKQYNDKEWEAL